MIFWALLILVPVAALIAGTHAAEEAGASTKKKTKVGLFFADFGIVLFVGYLLAGVLISFLGMFTSGVPGDEVLTQSVSYKLAPGKNVQVDGRILKFDYLDGANNTQSETIGTNSIDIKDKDQEVVTVNRYNVFLPIVFPWPAHGAVRVEVK